MSESTIVPLVSYLGWSFLPNLLTNWLQTLYYKLTIRAGSPQPQSGTAVYARDYKRIRILVLTLYLLYTLAQSLYDVKLVGDFYTLLSVNPSSTTDKEIKSRVRRLAARFHPDKLGSSQADPETDGHFLRLRLASETLTNPSHKYAYTHFGPGIVTHLPRPSEEHATQTSKQLSLQTADLIILALKQKLPSYVLSMLFVMILNTFFLPARSSGKFWRYLIISASFVLELHLLTHDVPALPGLLSTMLGYMRNYTALGRILPSHLLPFQVLDITSKLALSLNIFISQVSVLFPSTAPPDLNNTAAMQQWMTQLSSNLSMLSASSQRLDAEAQGLLELQLAPFKGQHTHLSELRKGMKDGMVLGGVRNHPDVKAAVEEAKVGRRTEQSSRRAGRQSMRKDGSEVVDLLGSDEQFT